MSATMVVQPRSQTSARLDGSIKLSLGITPSGDFTAATFSVQDVVATNIDRALFRIPLCLPPGATIVSATLTINWTAVGGTARAFALRRVTQDFTAGATYDTYNGTNAWPGGSGALADTTATNAVTGNLQNTTGDQVISGLGPMVADAYAADGILKIMLYKTATNSGVWTGRSIEDATTDAWKLTIVYTPAAAPGRDSRPVGMFSCIGSGPPYDDDPDWHSGIGGGYDYQMALNSPASFLARPYKRFMFLIPKGFANFIGGQDSFSVSPYGVGGTLDPNGSTAANPDIAQNAPYLNQYFAALITAIRAVDSTIGFDTHTGVWGKDPILMESDRRLDLALDLQWYLSENLLLYNAIGLDGAKFIDGSSANGIPVNVVAKEIRAAISQRVGLEAFSFSGGVPDLSFLADGPAWGTFSFALSVGLYNLTPPASPAHECIIVIQSDSGMPIVTVSTITKTFVVAGNEVSNFSPGTVLHVSSSPANDGDYTVFSTIYTGSETWITVTQTIPSASGGGTISVTGVISNGDFDKLVTMIRNGFVPGSITLWDHYVVDAIAAAAATPATESSTYIPVSGLGTGTVDSGD